ncbi:MAG: anhydro-N-acetylmuramic acid kinase [Bacteroidales bacterium]
MTAVYTVTGLMSGSSLDGIDLCCVRFRLGPTGWSYRILAAETRAYPAQWTERLLSAASLSEPGRRELDNDLGLHYGQVLRDFHRENHLQTDWISSHGHTILHEPARGITFQAGNGQIMADATGCPVVHDFRSADVAQGGQGAPLVPIGDKLLFAGYYVCLNLGGFANISYDGPAGDRLAYDTGPANMPLNWVAQQAGMEYDEGGRLARQGKPDPELLNRLNDLAYYHLPPPKSLGREWFLDQMLPLIESWTGTREDLLATLTEHVAGHVARGIRTAGASSVLATGGGAFNTYLMDRIREETGLRIDLPDPLLIRFKEALVFAFLGVLRIRGEINCLKSVTGGRTDLSAGVLCYPAPLAR